MTIDPHSATIDEAVQKYLTPKQLAERWQVCASSIFKMQQAGRLPVHKFGKSTRYALEDIQAIEAEARQS